MSPLTLRGRRGRRATDQNMAATDPDLASSAAGLAPSGDPGLTATESDQRDPTTADAEVVPDAPVPSVACSAIGDVRWRQSVRVSGRVRSVRVQPWADVPTLECTLVDDTGGLTVVFLGRRKIAGVHPGSLMIVEGVTGAHHEKLAMLNPMYSLVQS